MDIRRLRLLSELCRLGSMHQVAVELGITTSTVSQQIAVLAREAGTPLIEPDGRRVRLTPAGRRLADHAVTILAAVEAARLDLDPRAEPAGTLRVAGFATAIRTTLLPIVAELCLTHPRVTVRVREQEPIEAFELLAADRVDLALTYDFNLAPAPFDNSVEATPLGSAAWGLGIPALAGQRQDASKAVSADVFTRFRDASWIVNSRNDSDEQVVRTIASMAGFEPRIGHRADSLELVQDLIIAGLGIGILPLDQPMAPGVQVLPLADPGVLLRSYAVTRRGRADWPPLALIMNLLTGGQ